jgi:hypothetical protein
MHDQISGFPKSSSVRPFEWPEASLHSLLIKDRLQWYFNFFSELFWLLLASRSRMQLLGLEARSLAKGTVKVDGTVYFAKKLSAVARIGLGQEFVV